MTGRNNEKCRRKRKHRRKVKNKSSEGRNPSQKGKTRDNPMLATHQRGRVQQRPEESSKTKGPEGQRKPGEQGQRAKKNKASRDRKDHVLTT
jgi:hypothetical protein